MLTAAMLNELIQWGVIAFLAVGTAWMLFDLYTEAP